MDEVVAAAAAGFERWMKIVTFAVDAVLRIHHTKRPSSDMRAKADNSTNMVQLMITVKGQSTWN